MAEWSAVLRVVIVVRVTFKLQYIWMAIWPRGPVQSIWCPWVGPLGQACYPTPNTCPRQSQTTSSGHHIILTSMQAIKVPYDMHKRGFLDMVKGLLAWLNKVFWVFKVFCSFVSNAIYCRKIITRKIRQ